MLEIPEPLSASGNRFFCMPAPRCHERVGIAFKHRPRVKCCLVALAVKIRVEVEEADSYSVTPTFKTDRLSLSPWKHHSTSTHSHNALHSNTTPGRSSLSVSTDQCSRTLLFYPQCECAANYWCKTYFGDQNHHWPTHYYNLLLYFHLLWSGTGFVTDKPFPSPR